jgi:predicted metal-dependent hydrolase
VVRDRRFGRGTAQQRGWLGGDLVASAWFIALSATFPRGEAFFIESVKAHRDGVPPKLEAEIRAFVAQEINHTREHVAFNKAALDAGYDLARIDEHVVYMLNLARERPAIVNLAATMALEHFTAMFAHQLLSDPVHLAGAPAEQADLWRWHALEEIEHKAVAYDTWLHATRNWSRWRRWKLKALMMAVVTRNFVGHRIADTLDLLAQDGVTGWRARWQVMAYLFGRPGILRRILPAWLAYFLPGFHPWNQDDRALIARAEVELKLA